MISVITPTYNRGYIISNLYDSLLGQSCFDFEWIIIDDGSTDNTDNIIMRWKAPFPIRYYKTENGGKHRALNYGIPKAEGDYIFFVDSDDCLTKTAIERAYYWINSLNGDKRFAGVSGLRGWRNKEGYIGEFPKNKKYIDCKNTHRYNHHLKGDKAEIYRKDLLIQNPFPEFDGEKFIGEGSVWNKLSELGYMVRWFDEIIYLCEYLPDGLTSHINELYRKNFKGYTYNTKLNYKVVPFPFNLMAVSTYLHIAKDIGYDQKTARQAIGLKPIDLVLCNIIRRLRKIK